MNNPVLTVRLAGPAVGTRRLAVADLALLATTLERAIVEAARATLGQARGDGAPASERRATRAIEEQCRLHLVAFEEGSAVLRFEAGPSDELLAEHPQRAAELVLAALARVKEAAARPVPTPQAVALARLDRLDGHERLGGTLWDDFGRSWVCSFPPRLEPELAGLWRRRVEVEGVGIAATPGSPGKLDVERIRALEGSLEEAGRRPCRRRPLLEVLATLEPIEENFPAIDELPFRAVEI